MKKVFWINPIVFTSILFLITCKKEEPSSDKEYPHWPAVQTLVATKVDSTTAKLNGTVNGYGLSTTVTFEYGTTADYGSTVTVFQNPVTGDSITHVSADISDLTPSTTYHFRVKAENFKWINFYGPDSTFITTPKAKTLAATYVSDNRATLNGTINANYLLTTVTFEYGLTIGYGKTSSVSVVLGNTLTDVSADITGLTGNTIYHFRIKAENNLEVVYGRDMEFIAKGISIVTLEVTNITDTTAVSGGNITYGSAGGEIQRGIHYGDLLYAVTHNLGHCRETRDGTGAGSYTSNMVGLKPNKTYYVCAYVRCGFDWIYGNVIAFTTSQ